VFSPGGDDAVLLHCDGEVLWDSVSVVQVVKTRSARRRGVVRLSTVILGGVDAIR
jgi:hypothetical protein